MRTRWNDLPLSFRLTILYVGLLLIILVALGSFLYFDTREFIITTTAERLQALANSGISHMAPPRPRDLPLPQPPDARDVLTGTAAFASRFNGVAEALSRDLTWQDTTAVVLDKTGVRIANARAASDPSNLPNPDAATLARAWQGASVTLIQSVDGKDTLAVLVPIHFPQADSDIYGVLQMSAPLDFVDQVLARQRTLIGIGVTLALMLAIAGGLWLTQTALAPLRVMVNVCRRIAVGDLSQRVNLPQHRDETGQLAEAFDEMVARLDDAFVTQRQFVADASHELRTPLTAISGSLEVLLLAPEGDPTMTRRVLHGMRREVQRLTRLVTDLLTLTRLDARRPLNLQSVDLAVLGRDVMDNLRSLAQERQLALEAQGDTTCVGDADQLKQVVYNLLGNAIQATDGHTGAIVIRIQGLERALRVAVVDNGSGIAEPAQGHIFERFYRVDKARTRASGGSGLGLAIVKAIVEAHGGTLAPVESAVGRGTTIQFTLPRAK